MFVGQRNDPFYVNLGRTFDLINYQDPLGPRDQNQDDLDGENVTSLALEVPIECLNEQGGDMIIGGWTTASMPQAHVISKNPTYERPMVAGGPFAQVSRLGMPLVNEVVIGLPDKNRFNASQPNGDTQFIDYVTHPTLPELVEIVFSAAGVTAPNLFPREDLVAVFLTGVEGVNKTATPSEMIRLNMGINPTPLAAQDSLGAVGCFEPRSTTLISDLTMCDPAGFPNGRRPFDDVVDISLRVAMGALLPQEQAGSGSLEFTDGALISRTALPETFPYVATPIPGSAAN